MKKIQKKAALDPLFLERYLYGNRGSRKDFSKKIKKIRTIWGFLGKILVWNELIFCEITKKIKKIRTIRGNSGKIFVRDDPGKRQATGKKNQKKSEKIRRFPNFSGRYLVKAKGAAGKRRKEKTEKSLKKSDHFRIFVEDT